jgi:hypothetical protein
MKRQISEQNWDGSRSLGGQDWIRQMAGEREAFRALEIVAAKWCKEHIPRNGSEPTSY